MGDCLGEWDGAGAVIKRKLRQEQLRNPRRRLQSAADVVSFLTETMTARQDQGSSRNRAPISRKFWLIQEDDVPRRKRWDCNPIPGSSRLHSVMSVSAADPTQLMVRDLSCYCASCIMTDWSECENKAHVLPWRLVKLKPRNTVDVRLHMSQYEDEGMSEYGGDGDELADILEIGDNFAVPAEAGNDENVTFYILQCQKPKFLVRERFKCPWGGWIDEGEYVVAGTYYQKWGLSSDSFVYLSESRTAHVPSNLVVRIKFVMEPKSYRVKADDPVYRLGDADREIIEELCKI